MDELYMRRCFDLAKLGRGYTSPNPTVGAVIVHQDRIIGEGYHRQYGGAHAEVNAVNSVKPEDYHLLKNATLYCSLEPCSIFGKTPPCTDLIIRHKIPKVVLSYIDHTPGVDGLGVEKLRKAGIEVVLNVLSQEGQRISQPRNTFVKLDRPYIILKYALSLDGFLAPANQQGPFWMTNSFSKRLVHKWRSEIDAILIGTNTAVKDHPQLTNRLFFGPSPTRLLIDRRRRLPKDLPLFDGSYPTFVYSYDTTSTTPSQQLSYVQLEKSQDTLLQVLAHAVQIKKVNLMVEGGRQLLQEFIDRELWDEIRLFRAPIRLQKGLSSPSLPPGLPSRRWSIGKDELELIYRPRAFSKG